MAMTERDRVLDAFRNCITEPKCKDCPWTECENIGNSTIEIPRDLALAVMRELVAHEPRVMTLEEVLTADKPFFIEKPSNEDGDKEWRGWGVVDAEDREAGTIMFAVIGKSQRLLCDTETMGAYFRCWTARPTDEQRKAAMWDDDA